MRSAQFYEYKGQLLSTLFYDDERDGEGNADTIDSFYRVDGTVCSLAFPLKELPRRRVSLSRALQMDTELVKLSLFCYYIWQGHNPLVEFIKRPEDGYRLALRNRREVEEIFARAQGSDAGFLEVIEHQLSNGWREMRNGVDGYAGMTDALLITDDLSEEEPFLVYSYPLMWRYSPVAKLLEDGYIDLVCSGARPLAATDEEETALQAQEYDELL